MARRGVLAGLSVLAIGLVLIALAGPRTAAAIWRQMQLPVMAQVHYGETATIEELQALIAAQELALGWRPSAEHYTTLSLALQRLVALEAGDEPTAHPMFARALEATERSLAHRPADPHGWLQLARLRMLQDGPGREVARALAMSVRTGAHEEPRFLASRLRLMLANWEHLDADGHRALGDQIRRTWQARRSLVLALARDRTARAIIAQALADDPEAQRALSELAAEEAGERS